MKDFVFAPEILFVSYHFMFQKAFFVGTQHSLYVCPAEKDKDAQMKTGSIFNLIDGKRADIFLLQLVQDAATDSKKIHEIFSSAIADNNETGFNNIAYIDLKTASRMRFDAKWTGTGITVGYSTNLLANKYSLSNFGRLYKKHVEEFYKQFFPINKLLKAEENFQ